MVKTNLQRTTDLQALAKHNFQYISLFFAHVFKMFYQNYTELYQYISCTFLNYVEA